MRSRYIKTDRRPLPKKPRSKKIFGSFEDSNRWIRCWNCDAPLDTQGNRVLSGSVSGNIYFDVVIPVEIYEGGPQSLEITGETVLPQLGPDGLPIPTYTPRQVTTPRGCWRCGTCNLP
jgi:hypothetical protein